MDNVAAATKLLKNAIRNLDDYIEQNADGIKKGDVLVFDHIQTLTKKQIYATQLLKLAIEELLGNNND